MSVVMASDYDGHSFHDDVDDDDDNDHFRRSAKKRKYAQLLTKPSDSRRKSAGVRHQFPQPLGLIFLFVLT